MAEEKKLVKKLAEIMKEMEYIPKRGWNDFHKYNYALESDITDAVREKMAERDLILLPNILETTTREVTTARGRTEYIVRVRMLYTLMDGETGEHLQFNWEGEGQDAGDKAIYKAQTGAHKYAIMKLFNIPTGDDPENTSQADRDNSADNAPGSKKQGQASSGGQGKGNTPEQDKEAKEAENKAFFNRRDELDQRMKDLAFKKQSNAANIKDYVIKKANEMQGKSYKSINSMNIELAEGILASLETKAQEESEQQAIEQQEMLNRFTNQPE